MSCATDHQNIEEWKTCLAAPLPDSSTEEVWLNWIAQCMFRRAISNEDLSELEEAVTAYKAACPKSFALVPIALMTVGLDLFEEKARLELQQSYSGFAGILRVLPDSGDSEIDEDLLLGTCEWARYPFHHDQKNSTYDLLITFIEKAEELVEKSLLEKNSIDERAINFIAELKEYRDALMIAKS